MRVYGNFGVLWYCSWIVVQFCLIGGLIWCIIRALELLSIVECEFWQLVWFLCV